MQEFLEQSYFDNTVEKYLTAIGIVLVGIIVLRLFRNVILKRLRIWAEKTETSLDDLLVNGMERFMLPILNFVLLYYALHYLTLSESVEKKIQYAVAVVMTYYAVRIVTSTIQRMLQSYVRKQENGEEKLKQIRGITIVMNVAIWGLGLVFLFDNLGYNVTAIVTGLGIGGIAIALAAQNILGDLFNYFVIFFDRPFEIGDFITVDDKKGHVEYIGIKTTRLKSLSGEQLVISNSDLTNSRVHNFKRLQRRRILFSIGIVYETPMEKVKEIPGILKKIIDDQVNATFDRAHFASYGNFSLNFEIVYFIEGPEYHTYMDIQQAVNLKIFEEFQKRGIEFAYPTQTILLNKNEVGV
ncbi:MAG: mechanosensitive ion channel family protein [Cytophagales bacterium]|nr:mechanosensitive ion channel family protein [Cytophagales bacterium]